MQSDMVTLLRQLTAAACGVHCTAFTELVHGPNTVEASLCSQIVLNHVIIGMLPFKTLA